MPLPDDIASLIADRRLSAHLATAVDDRPHVAPVWYVYEGGAAYRAASEDTDPDTDRLWIRTGGKKLANVRRNPRVALSIERADEAGVDWAVQLLGTARVVDDAGQTATVETAMDQIYRGGDGTVEDTETDGGVDEWVLLGVRVGSATAQRYSSGNGS